MNVARRLLIQHLEDLRRVGVDFIPLHTPTATHPESFPIPLKPVEVYAAETPASDPGLRPVEPASGAGAAESLAPLREPPTDQERSRRQALLDEVRARYERDAPHRRFITAHTRIVFGEGDPCARVMFVGEAPGEEEDRTGRPFVGRAGQLLNKMIAAMGLRREDVYIANVLKTRPPDNATPTPEEAALCAPYLFDQIRIVAPDALVTLGLPATRLILGTDQPMSRLRGRWGSFTTSDGRIVPVMPTYHPAYVLRNYTQDVRAKVWSDLKMVMDRLALIPLR